MQWHYFFAVHADSAKGDLARANVEVDVFGDGETCSLHELLGPLLPEKAHHHDSPRRDVFLLRGDSGVPSSELHDLYTSHSTVAQKKAAEVAAVGAKRARPATAPSAAAAGKAASKAKAPAPAAAAPAGGKAAVPSAAPVVAPVVAPAKAAVPAAAAVVAPVAPPAKAAATAATAAAARSLSRTRQPSKVVV